MFTTKSILWFIAVTIVSYLTKICDKMFHSYSSLKNEFITKCSQYMNDRNFFALKKFYEKDLNSVRRLSYCHNLEELMNLLEKADILSEGNVAQLRQIVLNIGEQNLTEVLSYIDFYENKQYKEHRHFPVQTNTSLNYSQLNPINQKPSIISNDTKRIPPVRPSAPEYVPSVQLNVSQNISNATANALPVLRPNPQLDGVERDLWFRYPINLEPPIISNNTQRIPPDRPSSPEYLPLVQLNVSRNISNVTASALPVLRPNPQYGDVERDLSFKLIAERLGKKWMLVGQYLDLRAGVMDAIRKKHGNNFPAQIMEMLHTFEKDPMYERRTLRTQLTGALRKAKREDLMIAVTKVFDKYS